MTKNTSYMADTGLNLIFLFLCVIWWNCTVCCRPLKKYTKVPDRSTYSLKTKTKLEGKRRKKKDKTLVLPNRAQPIKIKLHTFSCCENDTDLDFHDVNQFEIMKMNFFFVCVFFSPTKITLHFFAHKFWHLFLSSATV